MSFLGLKTFAFAISHWNRCVDGSLQNLSTHLILELTTLTGPLLRLHVSTTTMQIFCRISFALLNIFAILHLVASIMPDGAARIFQPPYATVRIQTIGRFAPTWTFFKDPLPSELPRPSINFLLHGFLV